MNREECIKAIHAAELDQAHHVSIELFALGLISYRIYQHIKRDAQRDREHVQGLQADVKDSQTAGALLAMAARSASDAVEIDGAAEGGTAAAD